MFGFVNNVLSEDSHGKIDGVVPLVHLKSFTFGNYIVSLPFFNYGGISSDRPFIHNELLQAAIKIGQEVRASFIEFRSDRPYENGLPVKTSKVSMQLKLSCSSSDLWDSLPSKLRSQVRRPQKEKMVPKTGREDELESFYHVFSINMRDLGTPVYSKRFFKNILTAFPDSTCICSIYQVKVPVASAFLVESGGRVEIPWASSLRSFNQYSPNMLLYWSVLQWACDRGFRVFDFGRSTPDEGTYRFKAQWGAKPVQLYWYYWMREGGPLPQLNPKNKNYQMAIKLWRSLPVSITKIIGPSIVKNLP